jgi:hypothetical protein
MSIVQLDRQTGLPFPRLFQYTPRESMVIIPGHARHRAYEPYQYTSIVDARRMQSKRENKTLTYGVVVRL